MGESLINLMGNDRPLLCEDVLIKVLSKLPVKKLLRFRCVSKRWLYLISHDPHFFQLHSDQQSKSKPSLLFLSSTLACTMHLTSTDMEGNPISRFEAKSETYCGAKPLPTRFDLVCFRDAEKILICNPSTHEFITLPKPPFNLLICPVGFGYVESTDEYKVVCLISHLYNPLALKDETSFETALSSMKCLVFTLGIERRGGSSSSSSGVWREIVNPPCQFCYGSPAFVNGAIHWLAIYDESLINNPVYHGNMIDNHNMIFAFDVESEEFRLIPRPEDCPDLIYLNPFDLQLVELRGLLFLSCTEGSKIDLWMLKGYENGNLIGTWMKEYCIDLNVFDRSYLRREGNFSYYSPRDIDDTKVLIETYAIGLGYYHLHSTSFKGFIHSNQMPKLRFTFYVESLRSLQQPQGKTLKRKKKTLKQKKKATLGCN